MRERQRERERERGGGGRGLRHRKVLTDRKTEKDDGEKKIDKIDRERGKINVYILYWFIFFANKLLIFLCFVCYTQLNEV